MDLNEEMQHGFIFDRPWFGLYNQFVRRQESVYDDTQAEEESPFRDVPDELFLCIFNHLDVHALLNVSLTCRRWRTLSKDPSVFKSLCLATWSYLPAKQLQTSASSFGGWKKMYLTRPRLRYDGVYVLRSMRIKHGLREGKGTKVAGKDFYKPFHFIYFARYIRFFPDGRICTVLSAEKPSKALRMLSPNTIGTKFSMNESWSNYLLEGQVVQFEFDSRLASHPNMQPSRHKFTFILGHSDSAGPWSQLQAVEHYIIEDSGETFDFELPSLPFTFVPLSHRFTKALEELPCIRIDPPKPTQRESGIVQ